MRLLTESNAVRAHAVSETLTPRVGISRCLLGESVRVNGGHCRDKWITRVLEPFVDFVGVCPEVEIGMPIPRPPLRLAITEASVDSDDARLVESKSGDEWTETMEAHAALRADELAARGLDGFILKKDSPTCGVFRVKVYDRNGSPSRRGAGVFAAALRRRLPNLPIEEDGRLNDPGLRESFLIRIHTYARWKKFLADDPSAPGLQRFHARHKMLFLAGDPTLYRRLGRLAAGFETGARGLERRFEEYERVMMRALERPVTRGRHVNVLQHLLGFCKTEMSSAEKLELRRMFGLYLQGSVPRDAPVALVRYLLLKHEAAAWATEQAYLEPYDPELSTDRRA